MNRDVTLHCDAPPPPGTWTVLRLGYALTAAKNRPTTAAGQGYEVDKLSASAVRTYFRSYMEPIQSTPGMLTGITLGFITMDSWEAGMQNWTPIYLPSG